MFCLIITPYASGLKKRLFLQKLNSNYRKVCSVRPWGRFVARGQVILQLLAPQAPPGEFWPPGTWAGGRWAGCGLTWAAPPPPRPHPALAVPGLLREDPGPTSPHLHPWSASRSGRAAGGPGPSPAPSRGRAEEAEEAGAGTSLRSWRRPGECRLAGPAPPRLPAGTGAGPGVALACGLRSGTRPGPGQGRPRPPGPQGPRPARADLGRTRPRAPAEDSGPLGFGGPGTRA